MDRTTAEFRRLYQPAADAGGLLDARGRTRALVLEFIQPVDAGALGTVWSGVQASLGLPAPAIAVSGTDALQLWFSLAEPVDAARGRAFLDALRRRFVPELAPRHLRLWPTAEGAAPGAAAASPGWRHAAPVPAPQPGGERWSAFVAPDLAPVFAESPWLEMPPGDDGQAPLLAALASLAPSALAAAEAALEPAAAAASTATAAGAPAPARAVDAAADPVRFLQQVMNDPAAPLALRVDAAKALLPYTAARR